MSESKMSELCLMCLRGSNGWECDPDCEENPKINIGSGQMLKREFINFDMVKIEHRGVSTDMYGDILNLGKQFKENTFAEILSAHVIEHFREAEAVEMLKSFYRILRPGGKLVLEGPDVVGAFHHYVTAHKNVPEYIECLFAERNRKDWGEQWAHRSGWTGDTAAEAVKKVGFSVLRVGPGLTHGMGPRDFRVEAVKPM